MCERELPLSHQNITVSEIYKYACMKSLGLQSRGEKILFKVQTSWFALQRFGVCVYVCVWAGHEVCL